MKLMCHSHFCFVTGSLDNANYIYHNNVLYQSRLLSNMHAGMDIRCSQAIWRQFHFFAVRFKFSGLYIPAWAVSYTRYFPTKLSAATAPPKPQKSIMSYTNNKCADKPANARTWRGHMGSLAVYLGRLCWLVIYRKKIYIWICASSDGPGQPAHPHRVVNLYCHITKTCLHNIDPLKPHFYIIKLGFTGVYIIFLISAQKHRLWVLVRTASPRRF